MMEEALKQVEQYADQAHGKQRRKYSPERYIVHPVRVMEICREYTTDISVLSAALLHDVLEDTDTTRETLGDFLHSILNPTAATRTLQLVDELTDVYIKKDYPSWNRRKRKMKEAERIQNTSEDSQTIKYADIIDNCPEITEKDPEFAAKFLRECRLLLTKMKKGNKDLYMKSVKTVEDCLGQLRRTNKNKSVS
jgi:(p)ppGpp synthase/HD superfamily hydrolase